MRQDFAGWGSAHTAIKGGRWDRTQPYTGCIRNCVWLRPCRSSDGHPPAAMGTAPWWRCHGAERQSPRRQHQHDQHRDRSHHHPRRSSGITSGDDSAAWWWWSRRSPTPAVQPADGVQPNRATRLPGLRHGRMQPLGATSARRSARTAPAGRIWADTTTPPCGGAASDRQ